MNNIIKVLSIIIANVSALWAVVEFILYLVKDKEFNFISLYLLVISFVTLVWTFAVSYNKEVKRTDEIMKRFDKNMGIYTSKDIRK